MAIRDVVKVSRKTFFDPKAWFGWNEVKLQSTAIFSILRDLFSISTPAREETFEQAIARFNIAEEDVERIAKRYLHFTWFFVVCFLIVFAYAFFLLFTYHVFFAFLMALAVATFFLGQAFRFHFWHYQLSVRRLGVTYTEWKNVFLGSKE